MALTKEQILAADDIEIVSHPVPEWGGDVLVKTLTGNERAAIERYQSENKNARPEALRARVLIPSLVGDDGSQLFDIKDGHALLEKSAPATERLFRLACKQSALTEDDIEDLAKNSESDQNGDSSSD